EDLAGSGSARGASSPDPLATRVLLRGESSSAPSGRADDFSWPRAAVDDSAIIPVAVAPPAAPPPQRPSGKKGATDKGASKRSGQSAEKTAPPRQRCRARLDGSTDGGGAARARPASMTTSSFPA